MTDRTKRRRNQENASYLQFRCERDNYSGEVSESDVERSSASSQLDVIEVIGIAPDTQAETRVQQLSTLEVKTHYIKCIFWGYYTNTFA